MKKSFLLSLFVLLLLCVLPSCKQEREMTVMQFNIWHEGTKAPDGFQHIVDEIAHVKPDFVTLSEVRNYKDVLFCPRLVAALKDRGLVYYSYDPKGGYGSALLSRYPIKEESAVFKYGAVSRLVADVGNREVAIYSAHLDTNNYPPFLTRGYSDSYPLKKLDAPVTDLETIRKINQASSRDESIEAFIAAAEKDLAAGRMVILGGDFNEVSHLDWTESTKNMRDHGGVVYPWDCTVMLEKAGYSDAYREKYPDPVTHPGFTYPIDNKDMDVKELGDYLDADERDRIDFIFYRPVKGMKLKDIVLIGPKGSINKRERVLDEDSDLVVPSAGSWPSDHRAMLATFAIEE